MKQFLNCCKWIVLCTELNSVWLTANSRQISRNFTCLVICIFGSLLISMTVTSEKKFCLGSFCLVFCSACRLPHVCQLWHNYSLDWITIHEGPDIACGLFGLVIGNLVSIWVDVQRIFYSLSLLRVQTLPLFWVLPRC